MKLTNINYICIILFFVISHLRLKWYCLLQYIVKTLKTKKIIPERKNESIIFSKSIKFTQQNHSPANLTPMDSFVSSNSDFTSDSSLIKLVFNAAIPPYIKIKNLIESSEKS